MSVDLGRFCAGGVLALGLLLGPGLSDVQAQGQDDFDVPANKDWVKASCKNKDMPKNGYDIAKRGPEGNDCWWVKAADAQEIRRDIVPGTFADGKGPERPEDLTFGPETTVKEAFGMAWAKHDAATRFISQQRQAAERTFAQDYSNCADDVDCLYAASSKLKKRKTQLAAWERDADQQLDIDIRRVDEYFTPRRN
ncbi:MAG: hypothetical protein AAF495_02795 [Pseudomonadota bacterium]